MADPEIKLAGNYANAVDGCDTARAVDAAIATYSTSQLLEFLVAQGDDAFANRVLAPFRTTCCRSGCIAARASRRC